MTIYVSQVLDLLKEFRQVLDEKTAEDLYSPRILMTRADLPNSADLESV